jgi:hypothetical protein
MASCGPGLGFHVIDILDAALLRLRYQQRCGLEPNPSLPLLNKTSEKDGSRE